MMPQLPVIENCDSCSACCRRTPIPPFQPGEESVWDVPNEWLVSVAQRIAADQHFDLLPCVWLDQATDLCLHYAHRPQACRDFQVNSDLCRLSRWDEADNPSGIRSQEITIATDAVPDNNKLS